MEIDGLAGIVLIVSTAIVYAGFSVFPSRIYTTTDIDPKVGLVDRYAERWTISQALVILGSTTSVIGLALVTSWLQGTAGATLAYILKDMPPFVHYAMTLAIGLVLLT